MPGRVNLFGQGRQPRLIRYVGRGDGIEELEQLSAIASQQPGRFELLEHQSIYYGTSRLLIKA
jgi:hypothetical protein